MRLFIAFPLDRKIFNKIDILQKEMILLVGRKEKIKWVSPEKIHITLKFLGYVKKTKIAQISEVMREVAESFYRYHLHIEGGGVFPSSGRPRVLWVGCHDKAGKTEKIKKRIDSNLSEIGFDEEKRNFTPHITLGRIKYSRGKSRVVEKLVKTEIYLGKLCVEKINLYESRLSSGGAEYRVVESFEF